MNQNPLLKPELLSISSDHMMALQPLLVLSVGILIVLMLSTLKRKSETASFLGSILTIVLTAACSVKLLFSGNLPASGFSLFHGMFLVDSYTLGMGLVYLFSALVMSICSYRYLENHKLHHPEYYLLILFSVFGMILLSSGYHFLTLFLGLELMSFPVYALAGFRRNDPKSNESSIKYYIMGSLASAVMLYGVALLYGATGTLNVAQMISVLPQVLMPSYSLILLGSFFVMVGFLFKIASVPFQMWMPDVYEGAPTPVTGFMTTAVKVASFAALIRLYPLLKDLPISATVSFGDWMNPVLRLFAVLTLFYGNFLALKQTNLKRMLGYSSISHTGYLMIGVLSLEKTSMAESSMILYLVSYVVMSLGSFALLTTWSKFRDEGLEIENLKGRAKTHPWQSASMVVFLLSLAGLPPTFGFVGKYYLFLSGVEAGEVPLVILGVIASTVSLYYYLRVIVNMYMMDKNTQESDSLSAFPFSRTASLVGLGLALVTVVWGVFPNTLISLVKIFS